VADPIANTLERVVAAGYPARSQPRRHQIGQSISEEVLVCGPDDLPILLMVGHRHAATSLRPGSPEGVVSEIATSSVICDDLAASRRFYGDVLGFQAVTDAETPAQYRDLVCELVDAPPGTRVHFLLYAAPGEPSGKILLVHFIDRAPKRLVGRMRPGHLGFSLFRHQADALDARARATLAAGGRVFTPPVEVDTESGRRRVLLIQGPNEELLELSHAV
jgi:catechol 2,3-dioxygenase-like lactoylglutathione lyase family enzyme